MEWRVAAVEARHCQIDIFRGVGPYADVGWVAPRFVLADESQPVSLVPLGNGRSRLSIRLAAWRADHVRKFPLRSSDGFPREDERLCSISGTLQALERDKIRRLAAIPAGEATGWIEFLTENGIAHHALDRAVAPPDLTAFVADLPDADAEALRREVEGAFGATIHLAVPATVLVRDCRQRARIFDSDKFDTRTIAKDGEVVSLSLARLKSLLSANFRRADQQLVVEGDCKAMGLGLDPTPGDERVHFECERIPGEIVCRMAGNDQLMTVRLHASVRLAGLSLRH